MKPFLNLMMLVCAITVCAQPLWADTSDDQHRRSSQNAEQTSISSEAYTDNIDSGIPTVSNASEIGSGSDINPYRYDPSNLRWGWNIDAQVGASVLYGAPLGCAHTLSKIRPTVKAHLGKWFTPSVGSRFSLEWASMKAADMYIHHYQAFHMDLLWNLAPMLSEKDNFRLAPYFGTGCLWNQTIGHAPMALSYGVTASVKVSKHLSVVMEFGMLSTFKYFDGITRGNNDPEWDYRNPRLGENIANLSVGLSYRIPSGKKTNYKGSSSLGNSRDSREWSNDYGNSYNNRSQRTENSQADSGVAPTWENRNALTNSDINTEASERATYNGPLYTTEELLAAAEQSNEAKKREEEEKAQKALENQKSNPSMDDTETEEDLTEYTSEEGDQSSVYDTLSNMFKSNEDEDPDTSDSLDNSVVPYATASLEQDQADEEVKDPFEKWTVTDTNAISETEPIKSDDTNVVTVPMITEPATKVTCEGNPNQGNPNLKIEEEQGDTSEAHPTLKGKEVAGVSTSVSKDKDYEEPKTLTTSPGTYSPTSVCSTSENASDFDYDSDLSSLSPLSYKESISIVPMESVGYNPLSKDNEGRCPCCGHPNGCPCDDETIQTPYGERILLIPEVSKELEKIMGKLNEFIQDLSLEQNSYMGNELSYGQLQVDAIRLQNRVVLYRAFTEDLLNIIRMGQDTDNNDSYLWVEASGMQARMKKSKNKSKSSDTQDGKEKKQNKSSNEDNFDNPTSSNPTTGRSEQLNNSQDTEHNSYQGPEVYIVDDEGNIIEDITEEYNRKLRQPSSSSDNTAPSDENTWSPEEITNNSQNEGTNSYQGPEVYIVDDEGNIIEDITEEYNRKLRQPISSSDNTAPSDENTWSTEEITYDSQKEGTNSYTGPEVYIIDDEGNIIEDITEEYNRKLRQPTSSSDNTAPYDEDSWSYDELSNSQGTEPNSYTGPEVYLVDEEGNIIEDVIEEYNRGQHNRSNPYYSSETASEPKENTVLYGGKDSSTNQYNSLSSDKDPSSNEMPTEELDSLSSKNATEEPDEKPKPKKKHRDGVFNILYFKEGE